MSREIKFRAWLNTPLIEYSDGDSLLPIGWWPKASEYWLNLMPSGEIVWGIEDVVGDAGEVDVTIEQYTGLQDAYGVEIYEGDVIEGGVVLWFRAAWFVQWKGERIRLAEIRHPLVIGNIHENPELLEVE
jgi:hypothetical protein